MTMLIVNFVKIFQWYRTKVAVHAFVDFKKDYRYIYLWNRLVGLREIQLFIMISK